MGEHRHLVGMYKHNLDQKSRVIVPSKLRPALGETFVAAAVLDKCISLYPSEEWDLLMDKLETLPIAKSRNLIRYLSANAEDVQVDGQGRITLPAHLLQYAGIEKEITFIGAGRKAELWNPAELSTDLKGMTKDEVNKEFLELGF